jgi:hypothetical protein
MSNPNNNKGAAPSVSPGQPPTQGTLHASTGTGGTKGQTMEWIRVRSEGNKQAARARQVFTQRMHRCIRVGRLDTLIQVRNGESHFMDKLARDIGFSWRFCQEPKAETGGEIVKGRCGVELAASMLKSHQRSCKACRRVIDPGYTRKKRSDAKTVEPVSDETVTAVDESLSDFPTFTVDVSPEEIDEVIDKAESTPIQKLVDEVIDGPSPMVALIAEMSAQRDVALNIAAEYGGVIAAAQGVDSEMAQIQKIKDQMAAHRRALAAFIAAEGGSQ